MFTLSISNLSQYVLAWRRCEREEEEIWWEAK